jgi:hypothetical protein
MNCRGEVSRDTVLSTEPIAPGGTDSAGQLATGMPRPYPERRRPGGATSNRVNLEGPGIPARGPGDAAAPRPGRPPPGRFCRASPPELRGFPKPRSSG